MDKHILFLLQRQPVATVIIYSTCTVFLGKLPQQRSSYLKYSSTIPTIYWPSAKCKNAGCKQSALFLDIDTLNLLGLKLLACLLDQMPCFLGSSHAQKLQQQSVAFYRPLFAIAKMELLQEQAK